MFESLRRDVARALPLLSLGLVVGLGGVRPGLAVGGEPATAYERPAVAPDLETPEPIVLSPQAQQLSARYRGVFWTLAAGDRSAAIERAAALESQALAADPGKAIEWLTQADGILLGAFIQEQPDCALPLALFYQRLVLAPATHQRYGLTQRALRVTNGILERMALGAATEAERRLIADAHSGFAADLLSVPAPARAADVLGRGLVLAPEDADINIALAILLLRDRRPQAAQERLDQVLRAQPAHREARLRRALMRDGFSADGRAARELEKLATGGENDWIALVAAQEGVRRLLATADYDKSIAFLNQVLDRFPTDSALRAALAFAMARSGHRAEAFLASQAALAAKAPTGEGARRDGGRGAPPQPRRGALQHRTGAAAKSGGPLRGQPRAGGSLPLSPPLPSRRPRRARPAATCFVRIAPIPMITLIVLVALAPAALFAQEAPGLAIVSPAAGVPAFGALEVVVEPRGLTPRRMEFWFNGIKAGELTRPPWKLTIDTGEDNIERRFRVVATAAGGQRLEMETLLPEIHVDDELDLPLQQLYITATREGTAVPNLRRDSFEIFDQGRRQELVTFEHGDVPLTAVLLIDSSLSMVGAPLRAALAGAHSFAAGMAELDEAMLLLFSDRVAAYTPWSGDPDELLSGLEGVEACGGSAVNDHLFLALQLLEKRQGRRVVILLSDGVDVESLLQSAQVHEIATRSQALIYWIRASNEPFDLLQRSAWRHVVEHSTEIRQLAATVDASGGRRIDIQRFEDTEDAFQQVLTELRQQYVLGFYPDRVRKNGAWHPLRIEVGSRGVELRTREGYFDDR